MSAIAPSPVGLETPARLPLTARVRISTGLRCNARCAFCYYGDELNTQSYSAEEVARMLAIARRFGIRDIDFSGGEPTVRRELADWIALAKGMGFRRICAITNGIRTADGEYLGGLAAAGLNEVLLSIHGATASEHDLLVGVPGAFAGALRTLKNIAALGLRYRINFVVTRSNAASIPAVADLLPARGPSAFNFICFNDWVNAAPRTRELAIPYSEAAPLLARGIDRLAGVVPKVTVRYIPFCFLPGRERHVSGLLQNERDPDEWNDAVKRLVTDLGGPRLQAYFEKLNGAWRTRREEMRALVTDREEAILDGPRRGSLFTDFPPELAWAAHRIENRLKREGYRKAPGCRECSRDAICDGLEPAYAEAMGTSELRPVPGPPAEDPMQFRAGYAAGWEDRT